MALTDKSALAVGLLLSLIAFLVYSNTLGNGFVWDDNLVILNNTALRGTVRSLITTTDFARSTEPTPYYRPLTMLTFLVDQRLHGFNPVIIRLTNILLHAVNTFLVYRLARLLLRNSSAALLTGLLFAVHPLNAETVALNSARNALLGTLFVLAAYLVHAYSLKNDGLAGPLGGAVLFCCGMLSKELAVGVLPFIVALERQRWRGTGPAGKRWVFYRLLPYAVALVGYFLLRSNALASAGVSLSIMPGLGARLLDNFYIIPRYVITVLFPVYLNPVYFVPADLHLYALPLVAAWLMILLTLGWLLRKRRTAATLWALCWGVVFLLPVCGLFPLPSTPLADRYLYLPAIGLWLVVGDLWGRLAPCGGRGRRAALAIVAVIMALLALLTLRRNLDWKSEVTLFTRFVEIYPDRAYGYHNLGCAYLDQLKNLDLAERYFTQALLIDPSFPRLRTQLGFVRLQRGDLAGALLHYGEALTINPNDAEAHLNSGVALQQLNRYAEALVHYRRFLEIPDLELANSRPMAEARIHELSRLLSLENRR